MNYYNPQAPSYYGSYPQYNQYAVAPSMQPTPQALSGLNGKIVDSIDVVKATEVPIGGYGIFPKADLSEIYIKSWNSNGTTNTTVFKPCAVPVEEKPDPAAAIIEKISALETKIDNLFSKKEMNADAY